MRGKKGVVFLMTSFLEILNMMMRNVMLVEQHA